MNDKHYVFEFTLDPKENKNGQRVPMQVRISTDGDSVSITGTSYGEKYEGELVLKKVDAERGDQCWYCAKGKPCEYVEPCPI